MIETDSIAFCILQWMKFQEDREKFIEELDNYNQQVAEFQTFGDLGEVQRYLKRAQFFSAKLQEAADKVCCKMFCLISIILVQHSVPYCF